MESIDIISTVETTPKLRQHLKLNLLLAVGYLASLLGLLCCLLLIPNSPASSNLYKTLYFSNEFSPSKIFYFFTLLFSAKVFIQSVTLKNLVKISEKAKPNNLWMFICTFFCFIFGSNATLVSVDKKTSYIEAILTNFCCYTVVFVVCIHSTYLISGSFIQVNLSFGKFYRVSRKSCIFAGVFLVACFGLLGFQLYSLYLYSRLFWYLGFYAVFALVFWGFIRKFRFEYEFNFFALYCLALVPATATPGRVSQVLQATLIGLFVENTSRVGFENLMKKV
jgi:hypothetical protein